MTTIGHAVPAKRFLDIETALRWAYRDELPKRQHGGRYDSRDLTAASMSRLAGAAADDERPCDQRDPGFPAALGDPHPDSIIIETAVKHLADWAGHRFGADRMDALTSDLPLAIDPVLVGIEAIACMSGTVTINARMATRPKWSSDKPTPRWTPGPNGKPKVLLDEIFVQVIDSRDRVFYEPAREPLAPDAIFYREPMPSPAIRGGVYREAPIVRSDGPRIRRGCCGSAPSTAPGTPRSKSLRPSLRASSSRSRSSAPPQGGRRG